MKLARFKIVFFGIAVLILLFASACAKLPPPDPMNPIARVAVLPFQNSTNDMDGPNWVREALARVVMSRYYNVFSGDSVDQSLREKMNITLGGQLDYTNPGAGAPSPQDVGKVLDVDGLVYCNLIDFQNTITGFYNKKSVKAHCKLVNAKTAQVVWDREEAASKSEMNLSAKGALHAVVQKTAGTLINTAFRANPLPDETNQVVNKMRKTIPSGPVGAR